MWGFLVVVVVVAEAALLFLWREDSNFGREDANGFVFPQREQAVREGQVSGMASG